MTAFARARRFARGCWRSWPTRRGPIAEPAGRRRGWTERAAQEVLATGPPSAPSAEAAALDAERRAALLAALDRLDERDRHAIELRYLLDLSEQEMAAALRCRPGTVKSRLSRALERLRAQIGEAP